MKRVYDFLIELNSNNNREWFNANKSRFVEIQTIFNSFVERLVADVESWDEHIRDSALSVKDCTYRIYRDTRFSKDKSPYKTHMGAYICRGGKKAPYAGYYFHLEPDAAEFSLKGMQNAVEGSGGNCTANGGGFLGKTLLAAGLYCPEPKVVQSLRDEISVNGDSLLDAIALARGFELDTCNMLKKVPRGFENIEERWKELIRHKDFSIGAPLPVSVLDEGEDALLEYVSQRFRSCRKFNDLLNMAVDYAMEEM